MNEEVKNETAKFKVGSIYRQRNGVLVVLTPFSKPGLCLVARVLRDDPESKFLNSGGARRLSDGRYTGRPDDPNYECHLVEGELNAQGEPIAPTFYSRIDSDYRELKSAAALMEWLSKHMPDSLAHVRSFAGHNDFHSYMRGLTGVTQEHFDSHDHACAAYLDALMRQFAPTFYCAAETIKPVTTATEIIRKAWEKLGATYAANRIQRQEVDMPDGWARIGYDLAAGAVVVSTNKPVSKTPTLDKLENTAEPKRGRLTWADSKPFDKFADFTVTSDTATPDHAYSHPTTRVADAGAQTPPVCGSAWLVVR
jgi:hypothetical protein